MRGARLIVPSVRRPSNLAQSRSPRSPPQVWLVVLVLSSHPAPLLILLTTPWLIVGKQSY